MQHRLLLQSKDSCLERDDLILEHCLFLSFPDEAFLKHKVLVGDLVLGHHEDLVDRHLLKICFYEWEAPALIDETILIIFSLNLLVSVITFDLLH